MKALLTREPQIPAWRSRCYRRVPAALPSLDRLSNLLDNFVAREINCHTDDPGIHLHRVEALRPKLFLHRLSWLTDASHRPLIYRLFGG
jgi:hypothetical protein